MSNINPAGLPEVWLPLDHFDDWDPTFGLFSRAKKYPREPESWEMCFV